MQQRRQQCDRKDEETCSKIMGNDNFYLAVIPIYHVNLLHIVKQLLGICMVQKSFPA